MPRSERDAELVRGEVGIEPARDAPRDPHPPLVLRLVLRTAITLPVWQG